MITHDSIITGLAVGVARNRHMLAEPHKHPGVPGGVGATAEILTRVAGIELVDLNQPAAGLQSVNQLA